MGKCKSFVALLVIAVLYQGMSLEIPRQSKERASKLYPAFVEKMPSLAGKTVAITGASRGLGYVTALTCAKKGARVIMLSRSSEKAQQSLHDVEKVATGPKPIFVECDHLDFNSVREAAIAVRDHVSDEGGQLDVLCCNAGVMLQKDTASRDGYDITISTNVFAHFLLAKELIPELENAAKQKGEARIVNMSSGSGFGPPEFNPIYFTKRGGSLGGDRASYDRYHQSKLANLAFTAALDDRFRVKKNNVKALACTPGVCGTDMYVHAVTVMQGTPPSRDRVPSTEDGSLAQLKCISDPTIESGDLWGPGMGLNGGIPVKVAISPPTVMVNDDVKELLWDLCEDAVGQFQL